jgi:transcription initiation factor TFIID TATA-box-binding protein
VSQKIIFEILQELGGEANITQIKEVAKREYPHRTLDDYISNRLASLEKKGFVSKKQNKSGGVWKISNEDFDIDTTKITEIGDIVSRSELVECGLSVSNIVATLDLGTDIDLYYVSTELSDTTFEPEMMSPLVVKLNEKVEATALLYSTGRVTILGTNNNEDLKLGLEILIQDLESIKYEIKGQPNEAIVRNIHSIGDLKKEIDLDELSIHLGLENVEYNPSNFPGLIYRVQGNTVTIFRTGKISIVGAESYLDIINTWEFLDQELPSALTESIRVP